LLNGYALDEKVVSVNSVKEAAKDLKLAPEGWKDRNGVVFLALVSVIALLTVYLHGRGYLVPIYKEVIKGLKLLKEL